ncbi:MAG: cob(I)yrinic acid a,c-diamide adenosyltransferase [Patescibacteria group bacterium]|nr:cob(I)yrinic acid a,c-diamide adenosyltransferase [Candidatus Beckwithbacteria bacterium]MDZ4229134.1 cob(I)yrinic acid a,c-diamide adenosyltransferase [Patescibacteria group bacterium]
MNSKPGLVYVFTGDGKGKTSAALGVAVRAALSGLKVAIVQWYKEKRWPIAEYKIGKYIKNIRIYPLGSGFFKLPTDHASRAQHKRKAIEALNLAEKLISQVDVLVLDEVNNAVKDKLITLTQLIKLISKRGKTHLILTGRGARPEIVKLADLVTEMTKIKHPFDKGQKAVKGLDY